MILSQLYIILVAISFGARDGINYRLYNKPAIGSYIEIQARLKWWHGIGVALYGIAIAPVVWLVGWELIVAAILIRAAFFDIGYNWCNGLDRIGYLGTEANSDRWSVKIFGKDGAVRKMGACLLVLVILNLLHAYIKKPA